MEFATLEVRVHDVPRGLVTLKNSVASMKDNASGTGVPVEDLNHILAHTGDLWEELRGQRVFMTGGTGFFGCWLLESFLRANENHDLRSEAVVLTRDPDAFRLKAPHLASHPAVGLHQGDISSFEFPVGTFSCVIHAATEASARLSATDPLQMFTTIVQGTWRCLEFARHCRARKFLLTSSGAIYGKQPPDVTHIPEEYNGAPDPADIRSAYGEGKRAAEMLCALHTRQHGLETKIARCYAFVGPHLPLDIHFAIGNFIGDGLRGGPITVKGDGTPYRSYLYAADLAIWLWTILFRGEAGRPYNVGSEKDLTIAALANTVARCFRPEVEVSIGRQAVPGKAAERYVPSHQRARSELHLRETVGLEEAIARTARWYAQQGYGDSCRGVGR
jgi:nucleoside-diphosphate-sugar epimerase